MNPIPEFYRTFEAELVAICAPTLAGLKSGSIFSVRQYMPEMIREKVEWWNHILSVLGIHMRILKPGDEIKPTIIYVYRPAMVEAELKEKEVQAFLMENGYPCSDLESCLEILSDKLSSSDGFPHEIGLFIGYPLEDVTGFILNCGRNFVCCGMWKVYGCKEEREKYFSKCQNCQRVYIQLFEQGTPLEQLVVNQCFLKRQHSSAAFPVSSKPALA